MSSARSTFSGKNLACKNTRVCSTVRPVALTVEAKKVCDLTGKKRNKANAVTFSNKKSRKWQEPNLQEKRVYWEAGQRWVKLTLCTKAIKTLEKNGLDSMAAAAGIDLWKLPYNDARPQRLEYLAANKGKVPVAENPRAIKDAEKIAKSKKQPKYPVYEQSGRIVLIRPGMEEAIFGKAESEAPAPEQPTELTVTISE